MGSSMSRVDVRPGMLLCVSETCFMTLLFDDEAMTYLTL